MARYGDLNELKLKVQRYTIPNDGSGLVSIEVAERWFLKLLDEAPTADVVPKSEVEKLTINMNAYGLTAKRLAEENENLEIELENMRRNLGDAREGWNDAECEVERLRKALDEYEETSGLKQAKAEVASEIFAEIDRLVSAYIGGHILSANFCNGIAELKKKYTEVAE